MDNLKMTDTNNWVNTTPAPKSFWDAMGKDQLLMLWQDLKDKLAKAKEAEMEMRKYLVKRAFPNPTEGTNTLDLGEGYKLKAGVKFNYKLIVPQGFDGDIVQAVDDCRDKITAILPNEGPFIASRLFKYSVDISLTEYRMLQEDAKTFPSKQKLLDEVNKILLIDDAAPSLTIKEPKAKK